LEQKKVKRSTDAEESVDEVDADPGSQPARKNPKIGVPHDIDALLSFYQAEKDLKI
jgi:hypothetical protein